MYRCIVVAEGEFKGEYTFDYVGELSAFQRGACVGANLYGAGNFVVLTTDYLEDEECSEKEKELIREHLL